MPRSKTTWSSLRMLEYIEDRLLSGQPFRLDDVAEYFCCDRSLASMAMSAYRKAGGMLPARTLGFLQGDGSVVKGSLRNGAKAWFVAEDDFRPILGGGPYRCRAWDAIKGGDASSLDQWLANRILDYIDDGGSNVDGYFGISANVAQGYEQEYAAHPGVTGMKRGSSLSRCMAWENWR